MTVLGLFIFVTISLSSQWLTQAIAVTHLFVERPEIVKVADKKEATGDQPNKTGDPLSKIEAVDSKES